MPKNRRINYPNQRKKLSGKTQMRNKKKNAFKVKQWRTNIPQNEEYLMEKHNTCNIQLNVNKKLPTKFKRTELEALNNTFEHLPWA